MIKFKQWLLSTGPTQCTWQIGEGIHDRDFTSSDSGEDIEDFTSTESQDLEDPTSSTDDDDDIDTSSDEGTQ